MTPLLNSILNQDKQPGRKTVSSDSSSRWNNSPKTTPQPFDATTHSNPNNPQFVPFDNRHSPSFGGNNNDLGVSSSQDSRRTQNEAVFENDVKPTVKNTPKPPSLDIEPPFFQTVPTQSSNNTSTTSSTSNQFNPTPSRFVPPFTTTTTAGKHAIPNRFGNGATIQPTQQNSFGTSSTGPNQQRPHSKPNTVTNSVVNFGEKIHTTTIPTNKLDSDGRNDGLVPVLPDSSKYPEPPGVLLPPFEASNTIGSDTTQGSEILLFGACRGRVAREIY